MFIARGVTDAFPDLTTEDLNAMVSNGAGIPEDPAVVAATHGIGVAGNIHQRRLLLEPCVPLIPLIIDEP